MANNLPYFNNCNVTNTMDVKFSIQILNANTITLDPVGGPNDSRDVTGSVTGCAVGNVNHMLNPVTQNGPPNANTFCTVGQNNGPPVSWDIAWQGGRVHFEGQ